MRILSQSEFQKIFHENERRRKLYFRDYDPILGDPESEVLPRTKVSLDDVDYWLPTDMVEAEPIIREVDGVPFDKVIASFGEEPTKQAKSKLLADIMNLRMQYDYEFWAATCYTIQDKLSKKDIHLIHNRGQRKLTHAFEMQRRIRKPIRVIVVKARQWGGSTDTEGYFMWMQTVKHRNWHSAIVSKVNNQSANIRAMITKAADNYPRDVGQLTLRPFEQMLNTKVVRETGSRITISSAENPENLRSYDFAMIHMSECATWPDTPTRSGDDLAQTLASTVPYEEDTVVVKESTAKGVGGYFHDEWLHATSSDKIAEGKDVPVFVGWFEIGMYTKRIYDYGKFTKSMTEYNWWQWEQGATLEGIAWYNDFKTSHRWSDFMMKSEYPTTADEAFQTKSGKYFTDYMLQYLRSTCKDPIFIGDIRGKSAIGSDALEDIELVEMGEAESERLKIWIKPEKLNRQKYRNRFIVVVDIGGLHYKSDNSVISVFDRKNLVEAHGVLERAAIWYGHIDHDMLAWKAAQIATYYDNALLVIESNTIDTKDKKGGEDAINTGDHSYTVLNELGDEYDNMYIRTSTPDKPNSRPVQKYGWHMNKKTKYQAYDDYRAKIRDHYYVEYCNEAVNEASYLELKRDGKIEAMKGRRDDMQDTTAVGVYISFDYNEMDAPKLIDTSKSKKKRHRKGSAATF